ncbi:hypothetical protein [Brasilonema sp. UFV-L1]|uniref:hypothetical protein n=1 Tax=Brasilonema sp. UFV-L1 TaxID=2234130 RepID=UPI0030D89914
MVAKSKNPDFNQMTAYVPKEISVKFKSLLAKLELEQSEVIASLMARWIEEQENLGSNK